MNFLQLFLKDKEAENKASSFRGTLGKITNIFLETDLSIHFFITSLLIELILEEFCL